MKLSGKKLLVTLLYAPEEGDKTNIPISGRTRLMKMGFLFEKEILSDFKKDKNIQEINLPEYFAWNYGPFSTDFQKDLEFLINQEFIEVNYSESAPIPEELAEYEYWIEDIEDFEPNEYSGEVFLLTEKGHLKARELWNELSLNQKKLIVEFKRILNRATLDRILEYVYKKYPKYAEKSLILDKYLP